ncbi:MAG: glycosyltransferase [Peptostreptococcaceae bacterium]
MKDISVIITSYNAQNSIERAILSVLNSIHRKNIELIIVDDKSEDNTINIIKNMQLKYKDIKFIELPENSGSPSKPRNVGIENASSMYITFLDDDDYIDTNILFDVLNYAKDNDLDLVKGYLNIVDNGRLSEADRLFDIYENENNIITIISKMSTRVDFIVKTDFIRNNNIKFDSRFKLGEDTLFYSDIIKSKPKARYIDKAFYYHDKTLSIDNLSSTQRYGNKELTNHLDVWELVENNLNKIGLSYYKLRLNTAIRNSIINLVKYKYEDLEPEIFIRFSKFIISNQEYLNGKVVLSKRYEEIYKSLEKGDYKTFIDSTKRRIVIAGYDLKFILPIIPYIDKKYNVRVDEWKGHNIHDKKQSKECLDWGDIIWCEWLLGNSVWYSKNIYNYQKLIIRAHRFEIDREFGYDVDFKKVDKFITVGYYYFEKFIEKFNIDRNISMLLSNYVEENIYNYTKKDDYIYNIGVVGIVPKRKGYMKALKIINKLLKIDSKFRLIILGKLPEEFDWIKNNKLENDYYTECEKYIDSNSLRNYIINKGWIEKNNMFEDIGYVLSLSDNENPESFHLSPAEGICSKSMGLYLNWPGVEYIYPDDIIFKTEDEIIAFILDTYKNEDKYLSKMNDARSLILEKYSIDNFIKEIINIIDYL